MPGDPMVYVLDAIFFMGIYAILAHSLNLEYGYAGLPNFGKVAFFMMGAYTSGLMANAGYPYWMCLLGAMVVSSITGLLIALPALRLREDYLAIVTLAFGEILRTIFRAEQWLAGGVMGITVPPIFRFGGSTRIFMLKYVILAWITALIVFFLMELMSNSQYGRVLRAMREDELAIESLGVNTFLVKAQVFAIASGIAGIAGSYYAHYVRFIDPYAFLPDVTFLIWIMVLLGGAGNNYGPMVGAIAVESIERGARIVKDYLMLPLDPAIMRWVIIGVMIITILFLKPQGLFIERPVRTPAIEAAKRRASVGSR